MHLLPADGYAHLTPPAVLEALDAVGLRGDGRLLQLNSYENRVFQVFLEDGRVVVAKFYRPGRWSDAQILEEHAFALELDGKAGAKGVTFNTSRRVPDGYVFGLVKENSVNKMTLLGEPGQQRVSVSPESRTAENPIRSESEKWDARVGPARTSE